jgi:hypothetical protein
MRGRRNASRAFSFEQVFNAKIQTFEKGAQALFKESLCALASLRLRVEFPSVRPGAEIRWAFAKNND